MFNLTICRGNRLVIHRNAWKIFIAYDVNLLMTDARSECYRKDFVGIKIRIELDFESSLLILQQFVTIDLEQICRASILGQVLWH